MWFDEFNTPIGPLVVAAEGAGVRHIILRNDRYAGLDRSGWRRDPAALRAVREQLLGYFAGQRTSFELPLDPVGTPFQLRVWRCLAQIPYGATWSYADVARHIGAPKAVRAVGAANGRNPLPIVLPCHRVIGADGSLTGFGGGLEVKAALLQLEGALAASATEPRRGLFD
jgi:methylated-DNA-[protein]-cysteine S-methyltransferase